jgi:hypothetical protein
VPVEADGDGEAPTVPAPGDYVALSIQGRGDWHPEVTWRPDGPAPCILVNDNLDAAARTARIPYAYTRSTIEGGSVTIFLPRLPSR